MALSKRLPILLTVSLLALLFTAGVLFSVSYANAILPNTPQSNHVGDYVPIGASYQADTLELFAQRALLQDSDSDVKIWVLPVTYATDAYSITQIERDDNLSAAQSRTQQVREACEAVVPTGTTCAVGLLDIQVRADAETLTLTNQLDLSTDGIFILGGDQTIAMLVTADTPLETAISTAHQQGTVIGGTSAGAAVQSRYMIGGYSEWGYPEYGLEQGALDLWFNESLTATDRGLETGLDLAIIDQHVLERGRLGRLMQATFYKPQGQKVGLGVDWGTAVYIAQGHIVTGTGGWYTAVVLDQETYSATAEHRGPHDTLSIQDVAFHVLPAGPYGYDLQTRQPIISGTQTSAPDISQRHFNDVFYLPAGSGSLYLAGDVYNDPDGPVVEAFALEAQAALSPTLLLIMGMGDEADANQRATNWASDLQTLGLTNTVVLTYGFGTTTETLQTAINEAGAIFVSGDDQEAMAQQVVALRAAGLHTLLRERLEAGVPMLFDNAASAAVGERMSDEPTPTGATLGYQSSDSFEAGYIRTAVGLGILPNIVVEPRIMYDYLYGRLVSHVYEQPDLVAVGIERNTAVWLTPQHSTVLGQSAVWLLDGRYRTHLATGNNNMMAANWLLLDTYAPSDVIARTTYTLTVSQTGEGTIIQTPLGTTFEQGTMITLTASPEIGWHFSGWSGDCTGTDVCHLTMDSSKSVTATFEFVAELKQYIYLPLVAHHATE